MENNKNIVFVGGGVSTIFSVIKLIDNGYPGNLITVIEKGNSSKTRKPTEIMCGFFGAGSFSDFKNVYSLNQGGHLSKYTGDEKGLELMDQMKAIIKRFHPKPSEIKTVTIKEEPSYIKNSPFTLRQSEVEHLGTDYGQEMGKIIEKWLIDKGVIFLFNTEVIDIDFDIKYVICKDLTNNLSPKTIYYDELIIAIGKSGMDFLTKIINKHKLETTPKAAQIGVRFETDYKYFEKLAKDFYDFKLYYRVDDNISLRTFCCNNETAEVAVEETYGMKSYNGHAYKNKSKYNGLTNFGIMMEVKGIDNPLEFTRDLVKRCNEGGKGKFISLSDRKPNVEAERITVQKFLELYGEYANPILDFIRNLDRIFKFGDDYVFYLPEIKYLTNEIAVNYKDLSLIDYPNVHLCGDALSARGIVVSGCQGIYVAESLLSK